MSMIKLSPADHRLLDRIGTLTGVTPGGAIRGRSPLRKIAMPSFKGRAIRDTILRQMKTAAGPSTNQQFSESFAAMAYTFLDERSPTLREFMVGFQVIDRGDDGNNAFGVFGFELPNRIVQCPVFFVNGQIKGYQLMFVPAQQLFMPLHEGFVKLLINNNEMRMGEVGPMYGQMMGIADPGAFAGQMPEVLKRAEFLKTNSYEAPKRWAIDSGLYESVAMWHSNPDALVKLADLIVHRKYTPKTPAAEFISQGTEVFKTAATLALQFPSVFKAIKANDGQRMEKLASAAVQNDERRMQQRREDRAITKYAEDSLFRKAQNFALSSSIYALDKISSSPFLSEDLQSQQQESLARNGVYFVDKRAAAEIRTLEKIAVATVEDFESYIPNEPGKVKLLVKNEGMKEVTVIPSRFLVHDCPGNLYFTSDSFTNCEGAPLIGEAGKEFEGGNFYEKHGTKKSKPSKGLYVVMDQYKNFAGPLLIESDCDSDGYCKARVVQRRSHGRDLRSCYDSNIEGLIISQEPGKLTVIKADDEVGYGDEILQIPADAKFIEIGCDLADEDEDSYSFCNRCQCKGGLTLETMDKVDLKNLDKYTSQIVKKASGHYRLNGLDVTRKQAMIALVKHYHATPENAESLLNDVERSGRIKFLSKDAAGGVMQMHSPNAVFPMLSGPTGASENSTVPYVVDEPEALVQEQEPYPANELTYEESGLMDMHDGHPTSPGGPGAMGGGAEVPPGLQQTMDSGIEGPMDVAIIASVVTNARIDGVISSGAAKILQGNSEIGLILILLYAHRAAFEDMYAANDLKPLEDTLLTAFEACGDAYLRLKQTTVLSDPGADASVPMDHGVTL